MKKESIWDYTKLTAKAMFIVLMSMALAYFFWNEIITKFGVGEIEFIQCVWIVAVFDAAKKLFTREHTVFISEPTIIKVGRGEE